MSSLIFLLFVFHYPRDGLTDRSRALEVSMEHTITTVWISQREPLQNLEPGRSYLQVSAKGHPSKTFFPGPDN